MNLDELKKAAEESAVIDHNENPRWYEHRDLISDVISYPKNARFIALANPTTILALLKVVDAARVSCSMNFSGGFAAIRYALKELDA